MTKTCGDSVMETQKAFQSSNGGSIPTSSLHFFVTEISYKMAYDLVSKYHYLKSKRFIGKYCYGIIESDKLVGAIVYGNLSVPESAISFFGLPRGNYSDLLEMNRLVLHPSLNHTQTASKLIGTSLRFLKKKKIRAVISYADSSRHIGTVYQATNFKYYGLTKPKKDYLLSNGKLLSRGKPSEHEGCWVDRSRKHRYVYIFDSSLKVILTQQPYPKVIQ